MRCFSRFAMAMVIALGVGLLLPERLIAETVEVRFSKKVYQPERIEIKLGDTVRFINSDKLLHTATSGKAPEGNGKFDSGYMTEKMTFEFTPVEIGVIDYFCVMHSHIMRGIIVVHPR